MKIDPDCVPSTYEQAVQAVINALEPADRECILRATAESPAEVHHTVGRFIRSSWSLRDRATLLVQDCMKTLQVGHADDISGLMLAEVYARVRCEKFDRAAHIQRYHEHWKNAGVDPVTQERRDDYA